MMRSPLAWASAATYRDSPLGANVVQPGVGWANAFAGEIIMTFVLNFVVLETVVNKRSKTAQLVRVCHVCPSVHLAVCPSIQAARLVGFVRSHVDTQPCRTYSHANLYPMDANATWGAMCGITIPTNALVVFASMGCRVIDRHGCHKFWDCCLHALAPCLLVSACLPTT
jgi:hypothetical protein